MLLTTAVVVVVMSICWAGMGRQGIVPLFVIERILRNICCYPAAIRRYPLQPSPRPARGGDLIQHECFCQSRLLSWFELAGFWSPVESPVSVLAHAASVLAAVHRLLAVETRVLVVCNVLVE